MLGMLQHIQVALGLAQVAAPIVGLPLATSLASEIVKSCEDVSRQKVGMGVVLFPSSLGLYPALACPPRVLPNLLERKARS